MAGSCRILKKKQHACMTHNPAYNAEAGLDLMFSYRLFVTLLLPAKKLMRLFLLQWMPDVLDTGHMSEFLTPLVSVIKYNAAYLDDEHIWYCSYSQDKSRIAAWLINYMFRSYTDFKRDPPLKEMSGCTGCCGVLQLSPIGMSSAFHGALCRMLNMPKYCEASWQLMRKLLGTRLGHSSIFTMCCMLQDNCFCKSAKAMGGHIIKHGLETARDREIYLPRVNCKFSNLGVNTSPPPVGKGRLPPRYGICPRICGGLHALTYLMEKLTAVVDTGKPFEVFQAISLCTLDVIMRCAFSYHTDCQSQKNPYLYPDFIFYMTKSGREFSKYCKFVHNVAECVINRRRKTLGKECVSNIPLTAKDETGVGLTPLEIRNEVDTFMFEGHDTTCRAISWILYSLAEHIDTQDKVRAKVDTVLEGRQTNDLRWNCIGQNFAMNKTSEQIQIQVGAESCSTEESITCHESGQRSSVESVFQIKRNCS